MQSSKPPYISLIETQGAESYNFAVFSVAVGVGTYLSNLISCICFSIRLTVVSLMHVLLIFFLYKCATNMEI